MQRSSISRHALSTHPVIRRAELRDAAAVHDIITSYASEGILLARSRDDIVESIGSFYVCDLAGTVVGTVTTYDYGDNLIEIRSLAVLKSHARRGIGTALLRTLIRDITEYAKPRIFVLTYAIDFFIKNGFRIISIDTLPEKIWKDCASCSNRDTCSEVALEYVDPSSIR